MWRTLKCDKIDKNVKSAKTIYKAMLTRTTLNK